MDQSVFGIVYDVIFVLLVLAVAYTGMRRGFVSGLLNLGGSIAGIIGGVLGARQWAPQIYANYLGERIGERVRQAVAEYGADAAGAVEAIPFLPQEIKGELVSIVDGAAEDMVPRIVRLLEPVVLPIVQGLLFLIICLVVYTAVRILARALRSINSLPVLGQVNKIFGFALGFVTGILDCWLLAMLLWAASGIAMGRLPFVTQEVLAHSYIYTFLGNFNPFTV